MQIHDEKPFFEVGPQSLAGVPRGAKVFGDSSAEPFTQGDLEPWARTLDTALCYIQANLPRVAKGETAEVKGTTKDGRPYTMKYDYADLTDVSEAVLPLLAKVGLSWRCMPGMARLEGESSWRFVLKYELKHVTGASIKDMVPLPDRADPQTVGSHLTYLRRYLLCSVTGLAPGGDDDGTAAKEASRQGERLGAASELSLPPDDTDRLVAALEPQAMTPLADYWMLWEIVTKRRAADKPSPVEHDGQILTWNQLFGFSLAQRIEQLATPAQGRAFYDEAKAAGGTPRLPWTWEGVNAADRLKMRGKRIADEIADEIKVIELAIASAQDVEQLAGAVARVERLRASIPVERFDALGALAGERRVALERELGQEAAPESLELPDMYPQLRARIWKGETAGQLRDDLLGSLERGELLEADYTRLFDMLADRPEPAAGAYTWFMWQLNEAHTEDELDQVKGAINGSVKYEGKLSEDESRSLMGVMAAKRIEMKGGTYR